MNRGKRIERTPILELAKRSQVVRIFGIGQKYINGISQQYREEYPSELQGIITESDFIRTMRRVNSVILSAWPCTTCFLFGFACAPCALALSICSCPVGFYSLAEKKLVEDLKDISYHSRYFDRSITWGLHKEFCSSCIEISIPDQYFEQGRTVDDLEAPGLKST